MWLRVKDIHCFYSQSALLLHQQTCDIIVLLQVFRYISTLNYEVDDHNITYLSNEPVENAITVAIVATIKR